MPQDARRLLIKILRDLDNSVETVSMRDGDIGDSCSDAIDELEQMYFPGEQGPGESPPRDDNTQQPKE